VLKNTKLFLFIFGGLLISGLIFFAAKKLYQPVEKVIEINKSGQQNSGGNETIYENDIIDNEESAEIIPPETPADTSVNKAADTDEKTEIPDLEKKPADGALKITSKLVNWGFEKANFRKIDTVIIHSSYNALGGDEYNVDKLIKEYKEYGVSPHYLIDRTGNAYKLAEEKNIAYHAGESRTPDGRSNVNNFSIGIEMMNTKNDKFTSEQYGALNKLIKDIKSRYQIKYVLGHSQIAPGRKDDPWNFDWQMVK